MANLSSKTGFTPTQTRVSLANNGATTVQNMAAYDGQILTGFVYVDATTDYRAVVIVQVVKNGAGTYEVAAADISGDDIGGSPIVTFSMSGTNLVATLPNFTGFASAYIQYKLDAPALGANFPLTVDGSNVTVATASTQGAYKAGQAPGLTTGASVSTGYIGEKVSSVSTSFSGQADATARSAATLTLNKGVYNIYAVGVMSRAAGIMSVYEIGLTISTSNSEDPLTLANATSGRAAALKSASASFVISSTKFQSLTHSLGGVTVASDSTSYYAVLNTNGATWDGNATLYAVRIA